MRRRRLLALLAALPGTAAAQGFSGLGRETEGFATVEPGRILRFPQDHGPHPRFRIEWWYVTAALDSTKGPLGLQWTLFRTALSPEDRDGWQSPQLWFAHSAITTPERHIFEERFARGGTGQAGAQADPFAAWLDDWQLGTQTDFDRLRLTATAQDARYELDLSATGPIVLNGDNGYSLKGPSGHASYYYAQPHFTAAGKVTIDGGTRQVSGQAWLDREWSTQPMSGEASGWDWMGLHLGDGTKLMVYEFRSGTSRNRVGTHVSARGVTTGLAHDDITMTPLATARVAGREIPVAWHVGIAGLGIAVDVKAINREAFNAAAAEYWEGPVELSGSHDGRGYLEMTGY